MYNRGRTNESANFRASVSHLASKLYVHLLTQQEPLVSLSAQESNNVGHSLRPPSSEEVWIYSLTREDLLLSSLGYISSLFTYFKTGSSLPRLALNFRFSSLVFP